MSSQIVRRSLALLLPMALAFTPTASTWTAVTRAAEPAGDLRVMSFNIRYGTANDGENHWDKRRDFLIETIRAFNPDLLGTQETLAFQRDFLAEQLPVYDHLGVGRNDGREDGEMAALYYRRDRFEKLDSGHFWLSETPDRPGSKSWDSALPRMVTWVKLRDRQVPKGPSITFFNTHFDHQGEIARQESARLLRSEITRLAAGGSVIVTGDFNAAESSEPHRALFDPQDGLPSPIVDTLRVVYPDRGSAEGTFSGFRADRTAGPRIDWIGVSRDWEVREAAIDRTAKGGYTPSDHFPVTAIVRRASISGGSESQLVFCSAAKDQQLRVLRLNSTSGSLTPLSQLATPGEPGALTASRDGRFLFAAMRSTGKLASFGIDRRTGDLRALSVVEAGEDPAQISVDLAGQFLLTAYYVAGKVSVHRIAPDGSLSEQPVQQLATAEKAHAIVPDPSHRRVFVPHTGPNVIFQFHFDAESGKLTPHAMERLERPAHTGPRHLAWHPTLPIAYVNNEQSSSVTVYRLAADGSLEPRGTCSTLPPDFTGSNATAEIKIHPGGRFLYVSNRGHDSVAILRVDGSGQELTFMAAEPTEKTPRSFALDSDGKWLLSAGESSGRLTVSAIDPDTGRLDRVHTEAIGPMLWWVSL